MDHDLAKSGCMLHIPGIWKKRQREKLHKVTTKHHQVMYASQ